ncbi:MAG: hypothetical protein ACYDGR_16890 [Candidatus Dormibacteria bacterium]
MNLAHRLPSVRHLVFGAVLLSAIPRALSPVNDPDFFWHLRVGQWILDHHRVPTTDLFTYTVSGHRFIAHEWLSEVIMAALARGIGFGAVAVFFGLVTWLGFLLLMRTSRGVGFIFSGLALALAVFAGNPIWGPRTQMFTFTFTVVLLYLLRRYRDARDVRWLYPLPPLFLAWVNLHAGFAFGLGLLGVYLVGEAIVRRPARAPLRPLALTLLLCGAVVAINPNFLAIYPYALETQASPVQQRLIVEWFSPDFHMLEIKAFEAMILLLLVTLTLAPRRPRATDMLLVLVGLVLALQSVRHIALFVALSTPVLAEAVQSTWETHRGRLHRFKEPPRLVAFGVINAILLVAVAVLAIASTVPALRSGPRSNALRQDFPVAALDSVGHDLPPGNVYNQYGWGGYFVYREWPGRPVYIYGDAAVMGDAFLGEYQDVAILGSDFQDVLRRRKVDWVLFGTNQPLTVVLAQNPEWVVTHQDHVATILVRRSSATEDYLQRHRLP